MEVLVFIILAVIAAIVIDKVTDSSKKDKKYQYASYGQVLHKHKGLHVSSSLKQRSFDSVHNPNWERKISVGEMGELKTIDELKRLSCAAVYNDFHIYDLKTMTSKTQIDHLVLTPYGIILLESKNWSGKWVEVANNPYYWQRIDNQERESCTSPFEQCNRTKSILDAAFWHLNVCFKHFVGGVVFVNTLNVPDLDKTRRKHIHPFTLDNLATKLNQSIQGQQHEGCALGAHELVQFMGYLALDNVYPDLYTDRFFDVLAEQSGRITKLDHARQVVAGFPTPTTDEAHHSREHKEFLTYLDAIAPDHLAMSMNRSPLELFGKEWKR